MLAASLMAALGLSVVAVDVGRAISPVFVRTDGDDAACDGSVDAPAAAAPNCAKRTIQAGVNVADPGGVVNVRAGTYSELVIVDRPLTLRGAQAGNDAPSRFGGGGPETIVADAAGRTAFFVRANGVTIDGFTVQGATDPNQFGYGILLGTLLPPATGAVSGTLVLNNIIQDNIVGLGLANKPGGNQAGIARNLFRNNNQPGPASGNAIYTDQTVANGPLANVLILDNRFTGNNNVGVNFSATAGSFSAVTISDNEFTNNGNAVLMMFVINATIIGNTMTGQLGSQIGLFGGNDGVAIESNAIVNGGGRGIRMDNTLLANNPPDQNVTVNFNRIVANAGNGLDVAAGAHTGPVNAENNWWGCNKGPNTPDCEQVVGNADFDPWLVLTISPAQANILPGGQTTVTASLRTNSNGQDTSGAGTVPHGTPVTFATTRGTVSRSNTTTTNGRATTTFTAPTVGGAPATISATVDQETVATQVNFNLPPVAVSDTFTATEDTPLVVNAPGVLTGDTDPNADPLTAVLVPGSGPSNGTLTLNPNGSFTYTPNANFNGTDSFRYRASDGFSQSNEATVEITVNPVNDPPTISDIPNQTTNEDTPTVPTNFTIGDPDGLTGLSVAATSSNQALIPNANISITGSGATRTIQVTPAPDQSGTATITVTVSDGLLTATDTFTVTVVEQPEAPRAEAPTPQSLRVEIQRVNGGNGSVGAIVDGRPGGINCPPDCTETYEADTLVTLIATPARDSFFTGWSGGGCTGTGPCVVTLSQARTVAAQFTRPTCRTPDGRTLNATIAGLQAGAPTGRRTILGTRNADVIVGTDLGEVIFGFGGDDVICANGGNDRVSSGPGNDTVDAGAGIDFVDAGPGDDVVNGGPGNDELRGREGNDTLRGGPGNDVLGGGPGADRLFGDAGNDRILGEQGDDQIQGGEDTDNCFRGPTRFSNTAGGCEAVGDEP